MGSVQNATLLNNLSKALQSQNIYTPLQTTHLQRGVIILAIILVFIFTFAYTIVRYNYFQGVYWYHFPLYISNKAIVFAAIIFILFSFAIGPLAKYFPKIFTKFLKKRQQYGLLGFWLVIIHSLISLVIVSPQYFPRWYAENNTFNLIGELSLVAGILAFAVFLVVAIVSLTPIKKSLNMKKWLWYQRTGYIGLLLVMVHLYVMGIYGWLNASDWQGHMLPITLIAFIFIAITLLLKFSTIIHLRKE